MAARFTADVLEGISARFRALGEPMRLRILDALRRRELTVNELVDAVGASQANVSKHLAVLHREGFVKRRKSGLHVHYAVLDPSVFELCDVVCGTLSEHANARAKALRVVRRA
jgi:DNA-binding transcriptional ArsR family regulator